jgi:localization factor PodJL
MPQGERPRAVTLLREAAADGLVMAQYRLAKVYERGEGVPRDVAAARNWTEQAAIGGNVKAMHDLAIFYAEGDAGPQSYSAAVEWLRQAAELGLVDSQYNLAVLYERGLGVSRDMVEAAFWFEVAARSGDADAGRRAQSALGRLPSSEALAVKSRAAAFRARTPDPRANGEFGPRSWEVAPREQIAEIQRLLARLGYQPGEAQGEMGARTADAIRQFEQAHGFAVTGEPSAGLLRQLNAATRDSGR